MSYREVVPSSVIITFDAEINSAFRQLGRPCSYPLRNVQLDALKTIRLKSLKINILFKWDEFAIIVILCLYSNWFKNIVLFAKWLWCVFDTIIFLYCGWPFICLHSNHDMKGLHLKTRKCLPSLAGNWNFSSLWTSLWALCWLPLSTFLMIYWLIFLYIHKVLKNINQTLSGCKIQLGKVTAIIPLKSKYYFYMLDIWKKVGFLVNDNFHLHFPFRNICHYFIYIQPLIDIHLSY